MTAFDAIVIGGGPAGSSCARDLVAAGMRVVVLDRARFPRDKCCAGWITPHVVSALDLDEADYGRGRTMQPIRGFRTSAVGARAATTRFPATVSYGIRRCEFDHYLLARSGATLALGEAVGSITRNGTGWVVDDRVTAPMLVGAGGHFCPVSRRLNAGMEDGPIVVAQECEFRMTPPQAVACAIDAEVPELHFSPDRLGYGWCVRKGAFLNIGFGRLDRTGLRSCVADLVRVLRSQGRIPVDPPVKWTGHAYRLYARPPRNVLDAGVVLVGDSAGLAHPVSGEGILTAVESGRLAARAILDADGRYDRDRLEGYASSLRDRFGDPGVVATSHRGLPAAVAARLTARLLATPWFARHVLLDRWFLHAHLRPLRLTTPSRRAA